MKIALCKSYFAGPVSGADETLVAYALALHEAGHDVIVVLLFTPTENDQYYARLRRAGIATTSVITRSTAFMILRRLRDFAAGVFFLIFLMPHAPSRLRSLWQIALDLISRIYYRECRAHFASLSPDILHVVTPDVGAQLMIRAGHELGIPVIYQELGTPSYLPALDRYYRQLEKVLPLCAEVSALSPHLAAQWSERFTFLKSLSVMPLMVADCDQRAAHARHPATSESKSECRREIVFGYAARLEEGKGPIVLVKALARLNRDQLVVVVRIAGLGPLLLEVKALTRKLRLDEACDFVGHYSEPLGKSAFMRSLDVFLQPSLAEGTPNSIIEAMAHGLPIIASAVGGIPELLSDDCGILVRPGDDEALAKAMERLAFDPDLRARMGRAARERYLNLFSPEAVLPVLRRTYLRVASARRLSAATSAERVAHPWEVAPEF
ncbi:MAG: glycosyltransferase family 4 protein [Pyrinomonadaceae bacterium]|nr:glycosyltransferase family 4 protein [Pyrinomonadaceae bacterium]